MAKFKVDSACCDVACAGARKHRKFASLMSVVNDINLCQQNAHAQRSARGKNSLKKKSVD